VSEDTPSEVLPPGTLVGEYRIEGHIGEGGFGAVYRARHPLIAKHAAIKVLSTGYASRADHVSRFLAEARAANQIGHPNIVDIFSFGRLPDGRHYFVMELVEGVSLHDWAREPVPLVDALPILELIARALQAAHDHGIVHRDLKPANVLLSWQDGELGVKLIDFGIAKLLDEDPGHRTKTGSFLGTPDYMSPEQCRSRPIDHRSDIYAYGVLAYRLLTGRKLFEGDSAMDVMVRHMTDAPPVPSSVVPDLPPEVDAALSNMLAKTPAARPASVREAYRRLADAGFGQGTAAATARGQMPAPKAMLPTLLWLGLGAAAMLTVVALVGATLRRTSATPTREPVVTSAPSTPTVSATGPTATPAPKPIPDAPTAVAPAPVVVPPPRVVTVPPPPPPPPPPRGGNRDDLEF